MATLYVDRRNAGLAYRDGAIEVRSPGSAPFTVPLRDLDRVVVASSATLSTGLLAQCWTQNVGILVLSGRRAEPTARFLGVPHGDARVRIAQALAAIDPELAARFATEIVRAKIAGQLRTLRRLRPGGHGGAARWGSARKRLAAAVSQLADTPTQGLDRVRGIEGAAAAAYFEAFATGFAPSLGFRKRVRRPPTDPVNAALSLGYTLATFEAARQAQIAGLDPAIGVLHAPAHGRLALALDLVEPIRPRVDALVHRLFGTRRLRADQFRTAPDGAVLLGKAGRGAFYAAWETEQAGLSRLLKRIARHAAGRLKAETPALRLAN